MNEEMRQLYQELGYTGPMPGETLRGEEPGLPPLDEPGLSQLEKLLQDEPQETFQRIRTELDYPLTDKEIRNTVAEARRAFDDPGKYVEELKSKRKAVTRGSSDSLPAQYRQYPDIDVNPDIKKFEPRADALGWAVNTGVRWVRNKLSIKSQSSLFPFHHEFASGYVYEMSGADGKFLDPDEKIVVVLFGDFGSGLYYSNYIAKKMAEFHPHHAIHLGDVYYAGRDTEFKNNFQTLLEPLLQTSQLFALNANHEMMSGAFPYFAYLGYKRNAKRDWAPQVQEGSYFCIRNHRYQLIGIDNAFHENGHHNNKTLQSWLGQRLNEGKSATPKRINILLSQNEPYKLGEEKLTNLYRDLKGFIDSNLIDYWFWGNTHYGGLFEPTKALPFVGSCVGHGGHPIYIKDIEENTEKHLDLLKKGRTVAPTRWIELTPRFAKDTGLRQDMGNHGFCMIELDKAGVRLTYYDWTGEKQFFWEDKPGQ